MNNLKRLLPLLAFILGIGLVFTQSAFKNKKNQVGDYYAYDVNSLNPANHWVPVDIAKKNQPGPGGFICEEVDEEEICTGLFTTAPTSSTDMPANDIEEGRYISN